MCSIQGIIIAHFTKNTLTTLPKISGLTSYDQTVKLIPNVSSSAAEDIITGIVANCDQNLREAM